MNLPHRRPTARRLRELDSLRGIAAGCVLLFHLSSDANDHFRQWPFQVQWGHFGVELFFVISGFVILMTLEKSAGVAEFLISRVTRLYPAYWCAVLLTSAVLWAVGSPEVPSWGAVLADLTMFQSFMRVRSIDPSYWTLTAELIFYLLIVSWYRFRAARWPDVEYYALGWIAVSAVIRIALVVTDRGPLPGPLAMPILLYYGQLFIVGLCLYRFYAGQGRGLTLCTLIAACGYSLFGAGPTSWAAGPWLYFPLTCAIAAVVYLASRSRLRLLELPVLIFLGDISYPLYLIHQVVGTQLMSAAHLHGMPAWLTLPAVVLTLVAAAYLIHRLVEVPARTVLRTGLRQILLDRTAPTPPDPLQSAAPSSPTAVP